MPFRGPIRRSREASRSWSRCRPSRALSRCHQTFFSMGEPSTPTSCRPTLPHSPDQENFAALQKTALRAARESVTSRPERSAPPDEGWVIRAPGKSKSTVATQPPDQVRKDPCRGGFFALSASTGRTDRMLRIGTASKRSKGVGLAAVLALGLAVGACGGPGETPGDKGAAANLDGATEKPSLKLGF